MKRNELSLQTSTLLLSAALVNPAGEAEAKARARMALYRAQHQRGPPALRA